MKKTVSTVLICILLFFLTSCVIGSKEEKPTIESDKELTKVYSLADLEGFIKNRNGYTLMNFGDGTKKFLFYPELNEKFPVEVVNRRDDTDFDIAYTVYRVSDGGYYYVFWGHAHSQQEHDEDSSLILNCTDTNHMCVYYSAYYGPYKKQGDFASLKVGVSTAEDVRKIDPDFEYDFMSIRGRRSYSLIDKDNVLEIKYTLAESKEVSYDYSSLIIEEINIVPIEESGSLFKAVFDGDMP